MTLIELQADLATKLTTWNGGGWNDLSRVNSNGDVILRLGRGTMETPGIVVFESNMSEHELTVDQLLEVAQAGVNGVRVIKQYTRTA